MQKENKTFTLQKSKQKFIRKKNVFILPGRNKKNS